MMRKFNLNDYFEYFYTNTVWDKLTPTELSDFLSSKKNIKALLAFILKLPRELRISALKKTSESNHAMASLNVTAEVAAKEIKKAETEQKNKVRPVYQEPVLPPFPPLEPVKPGESYSELMRKPVLELINDFLNIKNTLPLRDRILNVLIRRLDSLSKHEKELVGNWMSATKRNLNAMSLNDSIPARIILCMISPHHFHIHDERTELFRPIAEVKDPFVQYISSDWYFRGSYHYLNLNLAKNFSKDAAELGCSAADYYLWSWTKDTKNLERAVRAGYPGALGHLVEFWGTKDAGLENKIKLARYYNAALKTDFSPKLKEAFKDFFKSITDPVTLYCLFNENLIPHAQYPDFWDAKSLKETKAALFDFVTHVEPLATKKDILNNMLLKYHPLGAVIACPRFKTTNERSGTLQKLNLLRELLNFPKNSEDYGFLTWLGYRSNDRNKIFKVLLNDRDALAHIFSGHQDYYTYFNLRRIIEIAPAHAKKLMEVICNDKDLFKAIFENAPFALKNLPGFEEMLQGANYNFIKFPSAPLPNNPVASSIAPISNPGTAVSAPEYAVPKLYPTLPTTNDASPSAPVITAEPVKENAPQRSPIKSAELVADNELHPCRNNTELATLYQILQDGNDVPPAFFEEMSDQRKVLFNYILLIPSAKEKTEALMSIMDETKNLCRFMLYKNAETSFIEREVWLSTLQLVSTMAFHSKAELDEMIAKLLTFSYFVEIRLGVKGFEAKVLNALDEAIDKLRPAKINPAIVPEPRTNHTSFEASPTADEINGTETKNNLLASPKTSPRRSVYETNLMTFSPEKKTPDKTADAYADELFNALSASPNTPSQGH